MIRTLLTMNRTLSTWFYQYWYFSFVTAQEWGKGPSRWTAELLGFAGYDAIGPASLTNTPHIDAHPGTSEVRHATPRPPNTCRWSIHVEHADAEGEALPVNSASGDGWSPESLDEPIEERLAAALQSNSFSDVTEAQLPAPVPKVVKSAQRSPSDWLLESLGFAIMGRSIELVESCLSKARTQKIDIGAIHPLHIATSYLDGGKTCCLIVDMLVDHLMDDRKYKNCVTNEHGHTIFDNLSLSVLRIHSTAPLSTVDGTLGERARYAGAEADICGRWSADSHCYRTLLASGERTIPSTWKHKFCHTSIQAVCHTIGILLLTLPKPADEQSGLFRHTCSNPSCGRRMQLGSLHTLVVVAMFLAIYSCADEDLLGMIACYLCMIEAGVEPHQAACLSVPEILGVQTDETCVHVEMTPSELAIHLYTQFRKQQPTFRFRDTVTTGWDCLVTIMRMAESASRKRDDTTGPWDDSNIADAEAMNCDQDELHHNLQEEYALSGVEFGDHCGECEYNEGYPCAFEHSSGLGHAWAVIQAELSTYRRLAEGDRWSSSYFSVEELLCSLTTSGPTGIAYIKDKMLQPYCRCGRYNDAFMIPLRQHMFTGHFSNMDGSHEAWERTCFTDPPQWYCT